MKKNLISAALEEFEEILPKDTDDASTVAEDTMTQTELAAERIDASQDRIDESEAIGDVLDTTADQLDSAAEAEAEPTEELAVAAEAFVGYACMRLGVMKPKSVSIESIKSGENKRAQLKKAAADIRAIRSKLDNGLEIAQEGMADDFKAFFEVNFRSLGKFKAKLASALQASNAVDGAPSGNFEAGWVEHLGVNGTANGSAVAHIAQQYEKVLSQNGLINILKKSRELNQERHNRGSRYLVLV